MALSREDLARRVAGSYRRVRVEVPELGDGESFLILEMSARRRLEFEARSKAVDAQDWVAHSALICVASIVGPESLEPLYAWDDVAVFEGLPSPVLLRVANAAAEMNVLTPEAAEGPKGGSPPTAGGS